MISLELANAIYRDRQREIEKALRVRSIRDEIEPLRSSLPRGALGRAEPASSTRAIRRTRPRRARARDGSQVAE